MKKVILLLALWLTAGVIFSPTGYAAEKWTDISYADQSKEQKLDIYWPENGHAPFPVIIAFHALHGDKQSDEMAAPLTALKRGYAVVCVNYREPPTARFPHDVTDAKTAVRFIRQNADKYNKDIYRL